MELRKLGKVCDASTLKLPFEHLNHIYVPTPIYDPKLDVIRVYFSIIDKNWRSSIYYMDLDSSNPLKIKYFHPTPVLKPGKPGQFDCDGVTPSWVGYNSRGILQLIYIGWQRSQAVPYHLFCGVTYEESFLKLFHNASLPFLDRCPAATQTRTAAVIDQDYIYYSGGSKWIEINGKLIPEYTIHTVEAAKPDSIVATLPLQTNEIGIGRPWVFRKWLLYSIRDTNNTYKIGLADKFDLKRVGELAIPRDSWDSDMQCFAATVMAPKGKEYLFYNGNNFGEGGLGVCEIV